MRTYLHILTSHLLIDYIKLGGSEMYISETAVLVSGLEKCGKQVK